ncbi:50S ribosomal protein L23 [Leptospirillum ferriphilum]|jgi:large subunit ribosomal protein L23|uniref:Large ribosomal subunit protein uL23 n=2 Tax=Leptospirillum TaxID=179 RepID=A0A094WA81_9BACT|nr:50S ribosomal protein L23 [Leptospirillum ferriphilum]EDZ39158.1 MAG: Ribosomal protein L23 [Leptospirillum sp. Group II '5-way CG']KGA92522.1 LSU ribosomal protein L23p (L23Ae) [Leptospirillum ferriphilum]
MDLSEILIRPIQTEKADILREKNRTYEFHVRKDANKIDIAKAVESVFNVKVDSVHTVIRKGKAKRLGRFESQYPDRKRAYVTLHSGHKLDIFEGA